jgi:hypothetical protein
VKTGTVNKWIKTKQRNLTENMQIKEQETKAKKLWNIGTIHMLK